MAALAALSISLSTAAAEHSIVLTDAPPYVQPLSLEVEVGDTVRWENRGPLETHAVTDEALMHFSADVPVGESWSRVFDRAGVFPFVCFRHHFMRGTITVRNPDGSTEAPLEFPYQAAFREYPLPTRNAVPRMVIASAQDDSVWFTEGGGGFYGFEDIPPQNKLGRLTEDGRIVEFSTPTPDGDGSTVGVDSLLMDPDGSIWFTERLSNRIGRLSPEGLITEFEVPTPNAEVLGIDRDEEGNIWFAERYGNRLGRIAPNGEITEIELPEPDSEPRTVFVDSRGRVWYTARTANEIGYYDPAERAFTRLEIPTELARPTGIAETADGSIYFVQMVGNKIGRLRGDQFTEYPIPSKFSAPFKIVADADGILWFTQVFGNSIGRLDPATGQITEFKIPTPDSRPGGIDVDRHGRLWFTQQLGNKIGMFDPRLAESIERGGGSPPAVGELDGTRRPKYLVEDVALPSEGTGPGNDLIEDPNGWIWFNQVFGNRLGAVHRETREYREIALTTAASMPVGMARDQDGMLWVAQFRGNRLAKVDPTAGLTEEFEVPIDAALPSAVAIDPDGGVWLALLGANSLAHFDPLSLGFRRFPLPVDDASPLMISADESGNLWITLSEERGNFLARFDRASETFRLFPLPTPEASPTGLLVDGRSVWVAEAGVGQLARFDRVTESWRELAIPAEHSEPVKLAKDRLGRIWLTDGGGLAGVGGNRLIVFDPRDERFELIPMARAAAKPRGILVASDGSVWFTQQNANLISRISF